MATPDSPLVKERLPEGPAGIPLLGNTLQWKGPETNWEWTQEYGPIYSVRMGCDQLVYLNTIELVEEYMERKGSALLGRPEGPAAIANGLLFGQGEKWQENRQAFTSALWTTSITQPYEELILKETDHVVDELSRTLDTPLEVDTVMLPALAHRMVTLLLGEPLDRDGEEMRTLVEQMRKLEEVDLTSKSTRAYLKMKCFRRPLELVSGRTIPDMFKMSEALQTLIQGWISRRRAVLQASGGQPCEAALLDKLLVSPQYEHVGTEEMDKELVQSVMDLFNGGVTTTLSVLEFALLYLIHYPDVQAKVKAELDEAAAEGKPISWAQRGHYPYTHATLLEALRLGSVTPSSLPHVATERVVMEEVYAVPKDVLVMASIFSLHRDPRYYQDAEVFRPERHLGAEGQLQRPRSFRPFGVGDRKCLGYHLAEVELFLFLARLVSAFRFRAQDPLHPPPFHCVMRVVRRLKPFACVLEPWGT